MIKFKQFIKEDLSKEYILSVIKSQCSDIGRILAQFPDLYLYRGMKRTGNFLEKESRENRTPRNSDAKIQDIFDGGLRDAGMEAIRGNSVYVTSDIKVASYYAYEGGVKSEGNSIYVILPKNGFKYTWFSKHPGDLVLDMIAPLPMKFNKTAPEFIQLSKMAETPAEHGLIFDLENSYLKFGPKISQLLLKIS